MDEIKMQEGQPAGDQPQPSAPAEEGEQKPEEGGQPQTPASDQPAE